MIFVFYLIVGVAAGIIDWVTWPVQERLGLLRILLAVFLIALFTGCESTKLAGHNFYRLKGSQVWIGGPMSNRDYDLARREANGAFPSK